MRKLPCSHLESNPDSSAFQPYLYTDSSQPGYAWKTDKRRLILAEMCSEFLIGRKEPGFIPRIPELQYQIFNPLFS
jgi:hypothetical protein